MTRLVLEGEKWHDLLMGNVLRSVTSVCVVALGTHGFLSAEEISPGDLEFFEKSVRPALVQHCYECHSEQEGKRKGGLWLDRKAGWELGGDSGPALVPGNPAESLLLTSIHYEDPDLEMPPDGKLPGKVIADLENWIARGAPDPRTEQGLKTKGGGMSVEEAKDFWSFRPRQAKFDENATIDDFVLAGLKEAGIAPPAQASPEARLRRAKTDLTGLLPTVEEQDEFLSSPTPEKWEEMVDHWIDSEAFGQQWGRHWLDLARYADSSGGGRALAFPDAWRFRDYVVDAFRDDMPLDQLIVAHLAGDLLPYDNLAERQKNLIATGFLVLGPHNYENQNKDELNLEIVDEQLDTMGRAFLGMTIGCARCHDHKFDPVPTSDYYAMAGIFMNTQFVTHANVSKWHTEPIPPTKKVQEELAKFQEKSDTLTKRVDVIKKELAAMGRGTGGQMRAVPPSSLRGVIVDNTEAEITGEWDESTSNPRWVGEGYLHDRNELRGTKSIVFRTRIEEPGKYELRLSWSKGSNRNPAVPVEIRAGREKTTVTVNQKLSPEHDDLFQTLGVFTLESNADTAVTVSNNCRESGVVIADSVQWLPMIEEELDAKEQEEEETAKRLEKQLAKAEKELKQLKQDAPDNPMAMCVVDKDSAEMEDLAIRIRGVESNHGPVVPRGFLQAASWGAPEIVEGTSGRLELAQWIVDSRNPLTARVLANRVWLKLLGQGIVRSADNFGVTGEAPTHPELLDYLAERLVQSGWSTKALVREILLSQVYSFDSENGDPEAPLVDPENDLYWAAKRRSLTAETMRDGMLALAGALDDRAGGPSLPDNFRSEFGYQFKTKRRSIYVPVFRNSGHEMFGVFDFANPNFTMGKRFQSTIATQALFMTNSELVHKYSAEAVSLLLQEPTVDDRSRVELAFRKTLSRYPTDGELELAIEFLRKEGDTPGGDDPDAWEALQRSLFACVDFRFLK